MPCDQVIYNSVDFKAAQKHEAILVEAMKALGYTVQEQGKTLYFNHNKTGVSGSYANGEFNTTGDFNVDQVKQQFGKTAVKFGARKYGWSVRESSSGKLYISKR